MHIRLTYFNFRSGGLRPVDWRCIWVVLILRTIVSAAMFVKKEAGADFPYGQLPSGLMTILAQSVAIAKFR